MSITMYTGRPRQGKTYLAVRHVFKELKKGRPVWSNIKLNWQGYKGYIWNTKFPFRHFVDIPKDTVKYWTKLSDLYNVQKGVILMDEAHVYMRSRKWEALPEEMERKLAQHGKDRLDIIATVQATQRIDVIVRELIDYWYVCRKLPFIFQRYEFDHDQDKAKKKYLTLRPFLRTKKGYLRYDSYSKVIVGEENKATFEVHKDSF